MTASLEQHDPRRIRLHNPLPMAGFLALALALTFVYVVAVLVFRHVLNDTTALLIALTASAGMAFIGRAAKPWRVVSGVWHWFTAGLVMLWYGARTVVLWDYLGSDGLVKYWLPHLIPALTLAATLVVTGWLVVVGRWRWSLGGAAASTVAMWALLYSYATVPDPQKCCPW